MKRLIASSVVIAALILAATGAAQAAKGVIAGTVSGLPGNAKARTVRVVDATNGRVVDVARLGGAHTYRVAVPSGIFVVAADALGARGTEYAATSAATRVVGGAVARIGLSAKPQSPPPQRLGGVLAHAASLASGSVVTINGVVINAAPGSGIPNLSLDDAVLGQIFDPCSSQGIRFVDTSRRVKLAIQLEQLLVDSGRASGPFQSNPIAPQYVIKGSGSATANGEVTVVLDLVDLATGTLVATKSASGPITQLDRVISDAADSLSQEQCNVPAASRCPRVLGQRQACVTSIIETGAGGTVTQSIKSISGGSCSDPQGFSRANATGLTWRYSWPNTATLNALAGGSPGAWTLSGAYRVDAVCGLNNEHCGEAIAGSRTGQGTLSPWTGAGRPGRWRLVIPALAAGVHSNCSTSAIDDPNVRNSASVMVTLRGRAGHPVPQTKIVPFALSMTLPCGAGCQDSYKLAGQLQIRGEW